jgi:putative transcriptional regulator
MVALCDAGVEADVTFAAGEVAADAANRGVDVVVVVTSDLAGRVTDALREAQLAYEVADL